MNKKIVVIHYDPEGFIMDSEKNIPPIFKSAICMRCDLRINSEVTNSIAWVIEIKPELVVIGVPDVSTQSQLNAKIFYEWLQVDNIPSIFVLPEDAPIEDVTIFAVTNGISLVTNDSGEDTFLPYFVEDCLKNNEYEDVVDIGLIS